MSDDDLDWVLLARHFAGEASPEETAALEHWTRAKPGRRHELARLRRVWRNASALPSPERIDGMWQRLAGEIRDGDDAQHAGPSETRVLELVPRRRRPGRRWRFPLVIAAMIAVAAGTGVLWREHRAAQADRAALAQAEYTFTTTRGQRKAIRLPDGSLIQLGVASRLRIAAFHSGRRQLDLQGVAVFDVVHDADRPFIVRAGDVITEDLGTRFVVRAYADDAQVRVVVASGKVALWPEEDDEGESAGIRAGVTLNAGEAGTVAADGTIDVVRLADTDPYFAWADGRLVFQSAALEEIAAELERWYDVEIRIPDPEMASRRVTIKMPAGTLEDVLVAATLPLGLRHVRAGRTVTIIEP